MQQIGYTIEFGEASQIGRRVGKGKRPPRAPRRAPPLKPGGHRGRIDCSQLCQIDFSLATRYRGQARVQCRFGIADGQCQSRTKHDDYRVRFELLAALAASLAFFSDKALIRPSIPPLLISAAKLPL
jgi:hypothetical protein